MKAPRVSVADIRAFEERNQFSVHDFARRAAERYPGVVGAGYRLATEADGVRPGLALDLLVAGRDDIQQASRLDAPAGLPVVTSRFGTVKLLARTDRLARPIRGGAAVGTAPYGTTGTFSCRAHRGAGGKREYFLLSCAHVLDPNRSMADTVVVQPSVPFDATYAGNEVADLVAVHPISFGGTTNYVDAAIAAVRPGMVRSGVMGAGSVKSWRRTSDVYIGMNVLRSGINSPVINRGVVTRLSTSVQVNFGGNLAWFADLIVTTDIAFGGDSGSLVLDEVDRSAIGLVMSAAEEEGSTMVCPIEAVQDALDVRVSDKVWSP